MKNILAFITIFLVISCTGNLEDLNENVKDPINVPGESLFTGAQKNLFDQLVSTNVNYNVFRLFAQYWTETTYTDESNYDLVTRTIPEQHWTVLYKDVLKDLDEAAKIIEATELLPTDDPVEKANKMEIIEILNVFTYCVLVETFGDVPYSEALDIEILLPKYDDGFTIYKDLLIRLDAAMNNLDPAHGSFGVEDNMYQGNVAQWIKFANSLKLRMGMLLSDVDNALAKSTVESAAPNVFTSNEDNAAITYFTAPPNTNPLYIDLVASGRKDFVAANTLVNAMNDFNDPRRPYYFTLKDGVYIGGDYGESNAFGNFSHIADAIQDPTFEGTILDYSEVEFLLAEAVERGFSVGGTAASHYNAGITASILYWGGTESDATTYLAQPEVAYLTAIGDYKQKLGVQSWIALYNRGYAAWLQWRKFDYPQLVAPPDAVSEIPVRYTYPIVEQTLNKSEWSAASAAIGGDNVATKLFWDKN